MKLTKKQREMLELMAQGADIWLDHELNWRLGGEAGVLAFNDIRALERFGAIGDLGIGVFQLTPAGRAALRDEE